MKLRLCYWILLTLRVVLYANLVQLSIPFIGGAYYGLTGDHGGEQQYLDRSIAHLKLMRVFCDDPDLQGVLDYTIQRYNRVGSWDVMFMPLTGPVFDPIGGKAIGCNCPWCPGVTLDTCLLIDFAPEETALVLAHEALHDYWPYFGHDHINAREKRLQELSDLVKTACKRDRSTEKK